MAAKRAAVAAALAAPAAAHMSLIVPRSRNAADSADPSGNWSGGKWYPYQQDCAQPGRKDSQHPSGCIPAGTDGWGCNCANGSSPCDVGQSCLWFSQGCTIGCPTCDGGGSNPNTRDRCGHGINATINARYLRTYNRDAAPGSDADMYKHNPWRAPGSAPVYDPCGMAGGGPKTQGGEAKYTKTKFAQQGDLGSKVLPKAPTGVVWTAGELVTTKWSIRANHGGGYQYRICPATAELTEACFQKTPLPFAETQHTLEYGGGKSITQDGEATPIPYWTTKINATFVSEGTWPKGSTWAMNPLPYSNPGNAATEPYTFDPPCPETVDHTKSDTGRCSGRDPFNTLITDVLRVPDTVPAGEYVLGIRWDCEKSAQIWQNCADVTIVAPPTAPTPPPGQQEGYHCIHDKCVAEVAGMSKDECAALCGHK